MKILNHEQQNKTYKHLTEIVKVLAKVEGIEADDALADVYQIAVIIGGKKMRDALGGKK